MNRKICDWLFLAICATLCFTHVPEVLKFKFLLGPTSDKLAVFPLLAGLCYTIYCQWKYGDVFVNWSKFKKYILVYLVVVFASLVWGLYQFPYYVEILDGPKNLSTAIYNYLLAKGFAVQEDQVLLWLMWFRYVKNFLLIMFFDFGGAYMVYCWYAHNWKHGFRMMCRGCFAGLMIVLGYGILDFFYLAHNATAAEILLSLNPYCHRIVTDYQWWPEVIFSGGFRSVFCEPSFFGMWSAVVLPFVWGRYMLSHRSKQVLISLGLVIWLAFALFLSQSRTCIGVLFIELFCLVVGVLWLNRSELLIKATGIVMGVSMAFFFSMCFFDSYMVNKDYSSTGDVVMAYVDRNIKTIPIFNKGRSNIQRLGVIEAQMRIFVDHPLMGVGQGLSQYYIYDYIDDEVRDNYEMKLWARMTKEKGMLRSLPPYLSEFPLMFAQKGLLGGVIYYLPLFILLYKFGRRFFSQKMSFAELILSIALIGTISTGFNDPFDYVWWIWIIYGIGFAMFCGKEQRVE